MTRILLGISLLLVLAGEALATEVRLGPEKPLMPLGPLVPAESYKSSPSVASNGNDFLAVWADARRGRGEDIFADIYASRISRDGVSTEPRGHLITENSYRVLVASAGGDYVVVYLRYGVPHSGCAVMAQRLDQDGAPLTASHAVTTTCDFPLFLTSNGTTYMLVVENDFEGPSSGSAILLDRDGTPLRTVWTGEKPIAAGVHGGNYVVVDYSGHITAKPVLHTISDAGAVADTPLPQIATTRASVGTGYQLTFPAVVAFSPDRVLLAWHSEGDALEFLQTGYDGHPVQGQTIIDPNVVQFSGPSRAHWNGSEFEIAYSRGPSDLSIARITADGTVVSTTPFVLTSHGYEPEFATASGAQIIVWRDESARGGVVNSAVPLPGFDIMARTFTGFDSLLAAPDQGRLISWSGIAQTDVKVARTGDHEVAVWSDRTDRIFAYVDGVPVSINGVPVLITPRQAGSYVELPAVGSSNSNFLIVWHDGAGPMLAERVAFDGRILDNPPIVLSANPGPLYVSNSNFPITPTSIASDGSAYLVTWSRSTSFGGVITARVENDGTLRGLGALSDVKDVYYRTLSPYAPQVSWTGNNFFVSYSLAYLTCDQDCEALSAIGGTALTIDGQFSQAKPPSALFYDPLPDRVPQTLAFGAGKVTYVWSSAYSTTTNQFVIAQTTADGTRIADPRGILTFSSLSRCPGTPTTGTPTIGWDGAEFVVAWIDRCDDVLRAVRLNQFGDPIEAPFNVAADVYPGFHDPSGPKPPLIVPTADGVVIVYSRNDAVSGDSPRAFERSLARLPPSVPRRRPSSH